MRKIESELYAVQPVGVTQVLERSIIYRDEHRIAVNCENFKLESPHPADPSPQRKTNR